jgi:HlyD family secretion protein
VSPQGNKPTKTRVKFNKKALVPASVLFLVAIIAWWQISLSLQKTTVKAVKVEKGSIDILVSAPSKVTLPSRADLSFKTNGRLAAVYVKKGQTVLAGQTLAELDMTSIYPQINQAQAGLKIAQAGLEKLLSGRSRGEVAVAEAQVDQARTAIENAQRALRTTSKLVAQSKQKATLGIKNAQEGLNVATEQFAKVRNGARTEERAVSQAQVDQAWQALQDAEDNLTQVSLVNSAVAQEAQKAYEGADAVLAAYTLDTTSTAYKQLQASADGAHQAYNRVMASNGQTYRAAQAQVNSARKAYDTAVAQHNLSTSPARDEDVAIAQSQLAQAEIALTLAKFNQDDASIDGQLDTAQGQLNTAMKASKVAIAQLELQKQGPGAADVKQAQGQVEQAQAAIQSAQSIAQDAALKAPFSGRVADVNGKVGEIAGMNALAAGGTGGSSAFITLINNDRIELSADIDETEVSKLKVGQNVRVMLDAYDTKAFDGKLTNISLLSSKNSTGGTIFEATVIVNTGKGEVREGMNGDIDIIVDQRNNVLTVPFEAIKTDGQKKMVYVIEKGIAHIREIKTGLASDTEYEVVSGLKQHDTIAVGKVTLTEGQTVKLEN